MADENFTAPRAAPAETVVIRETRGGSGAGWLIALVLIVALIAGLWLMNESNARQSAQDNAITNAANSVSETAKDVGSAAKDVADNPASARGAGARAGRAGRGRAQVGRDAGA